MANLSIKTKTPDNSSAAAKLSGQKTPDATCAGFDLLASAAKKFKLTRREIQVLHASALGECVKNIAQNFRISTRTVEYHRNHALRKINRPTLAAAIFELIFFAGQAGKRRNSGGRISGFDR
jgi:DNA-binding NarL/FixJ family response regulator